MILPVAAVVDHGLELFRKLNLQLLIVTPLQKIHVIEPFISGVGFVHNEGGRNSKVLNLSIEEFHEKARELQGAQALNLRDGLN